MTTVDARIDHLDIAARFAAAPHDWPVAPRFSPVQRWFHRLAEEPEYEVWLLTWLPGQETDLHDHGGSAGALYVVRGELTEDTLDGPVDPAGRRAPRLTGQRLPEGIGRRFGSRHVHRIANRSRRPAISVHVYGPALTSMTRYRLGAAGLEPIAIERAGAQW